MRLYAYATMAACAALACMAPDDGGTPAAPASEPAPAPKPKKAAKPGAPKPGDVVHVVWASPGHEVFGVGMMLRTDGAMADALRANGKARHAGDDEVQAALDAKRDIPDFS